MTFTSDKTLTGFELDEFLKLKMHSGAYAVHNDIDLSIVNPSAQVVATSVSVSSVFERTLPRCNASCHTEE